MVFYSLCTMYNRVCQTFVKKQDVLIFSKQNISWKMEIKNRGFYVEEKEEYVRRCVYSCIQCLYHIRGRKNNKVNYCSDEKERKIRSKGPPWHTLIIHNVLIMLHYNLSPTLATPVSTPLLWVVSIYIWPNTNTAKADKFDCYCYK